jgi:hypothetical protein
MTAPVAAISALQPGCPIKRSAARRRVSSILLPMDQLDGGMATRAGRRKRPDGLGALTRKSTLNMPEASWARAELAAMALNVSRAALIEWLVEQEPLDEDPQSATYGRPLRWTAETAPPWWTDPNVQEELPLNKSA